MITIVQSILIALVSYFGYMTTPWLAGPLGGWYVVSRPLVSGLICGIIMNEVTTGIIVGAAVQIVFIALVTPGTSLPTDLNASAYIGVPLGILTVKNGGSVETGVAISTVVGSVGTIFYNFICLSNEVWNKTALDAVNAGDTKKLYRAQWILPQVTTFLLRFVPVFLCVYYGQSAAMSMLEKFPVDGIVIRTFDTLGALLPAVGIGMLLHLVIKSDLDLVFYFLGFTLVAALGLNTISVTIIAVAIVYLFYMVNTGKKEETSDDEFKED